ncbi:NAD(P)H-binding protein [Sphingobacterium haloxyli]|uniref:Semialdehyde dehydrogenase n=1 Tax=Sphingobacterium haloxyli TaxID=2100533 RepID=A0A2S9J0N4_9SPHI|nr:NAD(P)H-binding protein [Sphingobacterium haloxyli]PRD46328.1 semialdehyde dehydrogenase [Sphingobacterium haloxyli]
MHALIIGATGATGSDLVDLLLADDTFQQVRIFVRRPVALQHEKLDVHTIDFDQPEQWEHLVKGDVLFSCLGTTLQAAGSKKAQWKIDYDYQYRFACAARKNNVQSLALVSSGFASAKSPFFYTKMKGQLEDDIRALGFPYLHIFRPPSLIRKNSDRKGELLGIKFVRFLNKIGLFRAHRPLPTDVLANALTNTSKNPIQRARIYAGDDIWKAANQRR